MSFGDYYNSLSRPERKKLADQAGTKTSYLRHVAKQRKKVGPELAKKIEIASGGACPRISLRPDIFA